jgi:hypothetical protein
LRFTPFLSLPGEENVALNGRAYMRTTVSPSSSNFTIFFLFPPCNQQNQEDKVKYFCHRATSKNFTPDSVPQVVIGANFCLAFLRVFY